jgi:hypothetical protein
MNSSELSTYVFQQLQRGLSPADITAQLRNAGWKEADISAGFSAAQTNIVPSPVVAGTNPVQLPPPIVKGRMKTGWLIFKQSIRFISDNPGLVRYIIMSLLFTLIIFGILIVIILLDSNGSQTLFYTTYDSVADKTTYGATGLGIIVAALFGYIGTFVTYYYGVALASHVLAIFHAKPGTYKDHIALARKRLPAIALYALIATVVGYILRMIEERFKIVGLIISRIIGVLWALATTFVLPIIADTNENAPQSIKHSIALFKSNWGETITGRIALTGFLFLIYFLIGIPVTIGLTLGLGMLFGVVGVIIAIVLFVIGIIVISTLEVLASNVLNVSLYYYAQYKTIPPSFSPELLASVFVAKKAKK